MEYSRNTQSRNVNSFNSLNSFNNLSIFQATIPDDKTQILQWLSSLEPRKRHQHLRDSRLKRVGQWIFQTTEFRRWNMGEDGCSRSVLFCHGDPGVGKTHLSSLVMDYFYCKRQDVTVAGLYCDYLSRNEQTISNMLGALLKQLVGRGEIPEDIRQAFEDAKGHLGGVGLEALELLKMLKAAITQQQRVVICIDGLDESSAAHRTSLLRSLQTIIKNLPNLRLFLTGRPFIRGEVEKCFPSVDTISVSPTKEDIQAFLETKLDGDTEPDAMDKRLRVDIMEIIPKKISEIFLLVSLSIEAILGETTIHRRGEKLKQISKGQDIGDLYTATLSRIRAQKPDRSRLGMEAIMWVAHSERPLRPEELCQALGVEIGSQDLNNRNVPSIRTILSCGLGLVTVDSSSSTVRLVHFTLQEYILANPTLFSTPHSAIAEVCLTYLNSACIKDLSPTLSSPPPTTPFLEYASYHWGSHARKEINKSVISLSLQLLDQFDEHISCKLLMMEEYKWSRDFDIHGRPTGFVGLHGGAFLGVVEVMISLLELRRWDPNATDFEGNTALSWAIMKGHGEVVRMLLDQKEVNPNLRDKAGRTPLFLATIFGRVEIVKMLLGRHDTHADIADNRGKTPFSWASWDGHGIIVDLLLQRNDVNPDNTDNEGLTPLAVAAMCGQEHIAVTLLGRSDVDPDAADVNGRTPFSWATDFREKGFLEILLELGDVNPDKADNKGRTPLSWAAEGWDVAIVEMLLERNDVNPDTPDKEGRTPLSWASVGWTDPDDVERDKDGDCDPGYRQEGARAENCERVAEMLLEKNDVNPDAVDNSGRTPLSWAASHGNKKFVKLLLERSDVNPNTADGKGRTPLAWATIYGHGGIVKMLLERSNVDPDTQDKNGRTPLSWAAESGYEEIAEMLLDRSSVNPDTGGRDGRTPLSWAAEDWAVEIVDMLLDRSAVNPDTPDMRGRTPLSWAAESGCWEIAEILLKRTDVNPDTPDESGQTPLAWAAKFGKGRIVEMLLGRNDVNPGTVDNSSQTPSSLAAMSGHEKIVDMLLGLNNVNSGSDGTDGTPFSWAAGGFQVRIPEVLFDWNNVNLNTAHESGQILLSGAIVNGRAVAERLLDGRHNLTTNSVLSGESFQPFTTKPSGLLEPPLKKIRRF